MIFDFQPLNSAFKMSLPSTFRQLISPNSCLQVIGTTTAYHALMAKNLGVKCIYLSGAGVANMSHGLPDLGITTINDVVSDADKIIKASGLPLLVDIDTGFGGAMNIQRTIKDLEAVGVAAVHMEDQAGNKRCGHRPNKSLVSSEEMVDRILAAKSARVNQDLFIMARSDSLASEGLESFIKRCIDYVNAGADGIFAEACSDLEQYSTLRNRLEDATGKFVPILANLTEFGKTPLFSLDKVQKAGVSLALYPLSPFRAANKAAENTIKCILESGTQEPVIETMQTRKELYEHLDYYRYEKVIDQLNKT